MAATALELFEGRTEKLGISKDERSSREIPWVAFDAADEEEAVQAVYDTSDITSGGLTRKSIDLVTRHNATTWILKVSYEGPSEEEQEEEDEETEGGVFSFDTGGGQQHITQSLATVSKTPAAAPSFDQAIGFDGQRVQGVDIVVPVFNFTVEITLPVEAVTPAYIRGLMDLTGKVNEDQFSVRILGSVLENTPTWEPGEVLFLGASGAREQTTDLDDPRDWKITLRFAASPNRVDVPIGGAGGLVVAAKQGWDYIWIAYEPEVDNASKTVIRKAIAAYVEKVYERGKFADLGLA